ARPLLGGRAAAAGGEAVDVVRVVLLDVSQSMAAQTHGIQVFERARSQASEFLTYQPGLRANLIRAAATAQPTFDQLSSNFEALHDDLARSQALPQRLDVQPAL